MLNEDYIKPVNKSKKLWLKKRAIELNLQKIKSEIWFIENIKTWTKYKLDQNIQQSHYIIDFVYYELAIEVDGNFHDSNEQQIKDRKKNKDLTNLGYTVIRIKAFDQNSFWQCVKQIETYSKLNNVKRQIKTNQLLKRVNHSEKYGYTKYNKPKGILGLKLCKNCKCNPSQFNSKIGPLCQKCFKKYQQKLSRYK